MSAGSPAAERPGSSYGGGVALSLIFVVVLSVLALANNVVIARLAGPEGRGMYGLAVAIAAIVTPLCSLGLGSASTWQLGRGRPVAQLEGLGLLVFAGSTVLALLAAGGAQLVGEAVGMRSTILIVIAAALSVPAQVHVELARGLLLGARRVLGYNLAAAGQVAGLLLLNLALLGLGDHFVLIDLVLAHWLVALVLLALRRRFSEGPPRWPGTGLARESLGYGTRSAMLALIDVGLLRIDLLVAAPGIGLVALGIYAIADQISHLLAWGGLLAGKLMLPESAADSSGTKSLEKLGLACRLQLWSLLAASVIVLVLGRWLIVLLFGEAFESAYLLLLVLLPATIAKSLHALVSTWLAGQAIQRPLVRLGVLAIGLEIVAVLAMIPLLGPLGVALGKSLAYLVQLALTLRTLRRERGVELRWWLRREDLLALRRWIDQRRASSNSGARS